MRYKKSKLLSDSDSENENKKRKRLEGTGGSLGGSVLPEDEEDKINWSTAVVTSVDIECPRCRGHFPSDSAYRNHIPCKG